METAKFQLKFYQSDKIKEYEMGGACSSDGKRRGVYRVLVGKPEGKSTGETKA
jgi:hypothetical protein